MGSESIAHEAILRELDFNPFLSPKRQRFLLLVGYNI